VRLQEERRRDSGLAEADDESAFVVEIHHESGFKVSRFQTFRVSRSCIRGFVFETLKL
jgi:hypothetical protein